MEEVLTVTLRTGVVPDIFRTQSLAFDGAFRALGYHWKAELKYDRIGQFVTFAIVFDPSKAPSRPEDLRARDENDFVATVSLLNHATDTVWVTSRAVRFSGASGGCFFPNICPVQTYNRTVLSMPDPILVDHGEHILDVRIKLELEDRVSSESIPPTPRRQGYREMFDKNDLTDVTVVVKNTKFSASSFVLGSQSDVFYGMLSKRWRWKEGSERVLRLDDIKPKTMSLVLGYMHLHDIPENISLEDLVSLMLAADKYNIRGLVKACEANLEKSRALCVSADGYQYLLDAFVYACSAEKPEIMETVMKLIKGPARNITGSEEFRKFLTEHPRQAAAMFGLLNSQSM